MSKIVKYTEFKKVVDGLWSKVKTNFITDITYNSTDKKLKKTKNGAETEITKIVTEWQDLEYVTQSNNFNIFNPSTFVDGVYYNAVGAPEYGNEWGNFKIACNDGDTFTLFKKSHDSINLALFNGDIWVQNLVVQQNKENGWEKYTINVPQNIQVNSISIPVHKRTNNYKNQVMIFRGDVQAPTEFIPFTNNREISIDGEKVAITFDSSNTTLTSSTTVDAIKELDGKIINTGTVKSVNGQNPNPQGAVTVNAEHIGYDKTQTQIQADTVQQAIDMLKQDVDLLPTASIYIVQDKTELDDLLGRNVLNHGDLIYIINSTGVIDFNGQPANGGNPVAMIFDTLLATGNKLRVFSKFNSTVHITATNVEYDDAQTNLQANNVQGAIGKLNEKIDTKVTSVEYNNDKTLSVTTGGVRQDYDLTPLVGIKSINNQTGIDGAVVIGGDDIQVDLKGVSDTIQSHLDSIDNRVTQNLNNIASASIDSTNALNIANRVNQTVTNNTNSINTLNGTVNDHANRIRVLERKVPTVRVGDLIQTFGYHGNSYTQGGVEYIWLGRTNNIVQRGQYPDLFTAFGLQSTVNAFELPHIQDQSVGFDYGKNRFRKTYIVAKIS